MDHDASSDDREEREQADRDALNDNLNEFLLRDCCGDSCPVCVAFRKLAHHLLREGCTVAIVQNAINPGGWFEPGMIHVTRRDIRVNANGTKAELSFLAHEAGHWQSRARGWLDPMFDEVHKKKFEASATLRPAEQLVILEEEEQAWKLGRRLLTEIEPKLPDEFWDAFTIARERSLDTYRALTACMSDATPKYGVPLSLTGRV